MKKLAFLAISLMMAVSCYGSAYLCYVDFGTEAHVTASPDDDGHTWNNAVWGGAGDSAAIELTSMTGVKTGVELLKTDGFLGAYDSGENEQTLFPATAGKDRWSLEKGKTETGTIRLSGFKPNYIVRLEFFGIRDAPVEFLTKYSSQGKEVSLNCQNNRDQLAILGGLRPDSDGNIDIEVSIDSGPNGHLSAMIVKMREDRSAGSQVKETPKPAPAPAAAPKPSPEVKKAPAPPKPKPAPTPAYQPPVQQETEPDLSALGLEESSGNLVLMITGIIFILLGLGAIGGSVWYYLKPEKSSEQNEG